MLTLTLTLGSISAASLMKEVRQHGACLAPFTCVSVVEVAMPRVKSGEALVAVRGSSVNPSDVDTVEGGGCVLGCGADISGVVVECNGCTRIKVGDAIWSLGEPAYAQYAAVAETILSLKPPSLNFTQAATVPEVGLTSLLSLKRTGSLPGTPLPVGSPWTAANFSPQRLANLTVLLTAGSGGTGAIGIELAKAYGAKHIATATTGAAGIEFVKDLGATFVTDYKVQDIFEALSANTVDIVYDNYGAEGSADKAMKVLRPGGVYLLMPHGECFEKKTQGPPCLSANPKPGVRQLNYVTGPDFEAHGLAALDELASLFSKGQLSTHIDRIYALESAANAFNYSAGPGEGGVGEHIGKIAIEIPAI